MPGSRNFQQRSAAVLVAAAILIGLTYRVAAADDPPRGRWIIGTSAPRRGETIAVWLVVQPVDGAKDIMVTVGTPHAATFIAGPPASVHWTPNTADQTLTCHLAGQGSTLLEFQLTPHATGSLGLVAIVQQSGPALKPVNDVFASETMTIRSPIDLGPTWTAVVSALFGFIAGIATQIIQRWRDGVQKQREAIREVIAKLAQTLAPEITANQQALSTYVAASAGHPPTLAVGGYNTLSTGALAYLSAAERRPYLGRVDALYQGIGVYNSKVARNPADPTLPNEAATVIALMAQLPN
jgi:hypothetical protein